MIREAIFFLALLLLTMALPQPALAQKHAQLQLRRGEKGSVGLPLRNSCSAPHTYELSTPPETEWLSLSGERAAVVTPGATKTFVAEVDSSDLDVGKYFVEVPGICSDCADEPGCRAAKLAFNIQLIVRWPRAELESLQASQYVAGQVLVALNVAPSKDIDEVVREIKKTYQLEPLKVIKLSSVSRILVLFSILNPQDSVPQVVRKLEGAASIDSSQPNFIYTGFSTQVRDYERSQYGPKLIKADLVRRYSTGKGIRIAIIDTGIDDEHTDLKGIVSESRNFTNDESSGHDVHGTMVAGIIAAIPHNGFGISGVAPGAKLISIKVLKQKAGEAEPTGTAGVVVQGVDYAIQKRANVINMSFGTPERDPEVAKIVKAAVRRGAVVVAAAGNSGPQGVIMYPAALNEAIAVSAIGPNNSLYASGTSGDYIDLTAPGVDILSTSPGNAFTRSTGTSAAAAHVTGVVALLLEKKPHTSPIKIRELLEKTSTDIEPRDKDRLFGWGLVDACKALEALSGGGRICSGQ